MGVFKEGQPNCADCPIRPEDCPIKKGIERYQGVDGDRSTLGILRVAQFLCQRYKNNSS